MYGFDGLRRMSEMVWWVGGVAQVCLSPGRPYPQIGELAIKSTTMAPNRGPSGAPGILGTAGRLCIRMRCTKTPKTAFDWLCWLILWRAHLIGGMAGRG